MLSGDGWDDCLLRELAGDSCLGIQCGRISSNTVSSQYAWKLFEVTRSYYQLPGTTRNCPALPVSCRGPSERSASVVELV